MASASTTNEPNVQQAFRDAVHPYWPLLLGLWPLWALLALVAVGKVGAYAWKLRRLNRAGMVEIDRMSGHEFEAKLALMFRSLGYRAEVVGSSGGDFGGDLVLSRKGTVTVVQAKRWKTNVGVGAVQEAVAAKAMYRAGEAMVVTNSRFTKQAEQLARMNNVKLWGREELIGALLSGQKSKQGVTPRELPPVGTSFSSTPHLAVEETMAVAERAARAVASPSGAYCARCGEPVSAKVRAYCLANDERFRGLVYCFSDQRAFERRR